MATLSLAATLRLLGLGLYLLGQAVQVVRVEISPQTKCGFDLEGTATFTLVATSRDSEFGEDTVVAKVKGGAALKDLPQAILAAGEELFLIVERAFKKKFVR